MNKIRVKTAALPAGLPAKFWLAIAAIVLALLALPHVGHAQGIVRGAQEGSYEGNRSPARWAAWSAARSAPASAAPWARSRACSAFPIAATARLSLPRLLQPLRSFPLISDSHDALWYARQFFSR